MRFLLLVLAFVVSGRATTQPDAVLRGEAFDQRLLNVLIAHQDDAVQMARWETAGGADPEVKDLADRSTSPAPRRSA